MIGWFALLVVAAFYYVPWLKRVIGGFLYQNPYVQKLPGPKGLPFIGSIMDLAGDTTVPLKFWIREADKARAEGHGIFTMTALGRTITFPINGDTLRYICESSEEVVKGKDYEYLRAWVGDGILLSIGQKWRDRRKSYTQLFHFSMLDGYLETFNKHARIMTEVLAENSGRIVDMSDLVKRLGLDSICDTAMGYHFGTQKNPDHPYITAVDIFTKYSQRYNTEPQMWVTWIWYLLYHRDYKHALDNLNALTEEIMNARLKKVESGEVDLNAKKRPLIDHFFALHQKGEWTLEEVHYEINAAIFGGHDTTGSTLTWIFWALATQPHFQQQCYEEIRDIFGDSDRDTTHEDMKAMVLTERFMKETMRIFPPIPVVERELQNDFQMGPYLLPKGSEVFITPHLVQHNPEVYPDPWKFDPDRFLPENIDKRSPYDFVPFSAGTRNCLGQKFAMHEMKTVLAWALRKFSFHTHHNLLDQELAIEVISKPTLGVNLKVIPRN
ncbi:hypothetical protein PRIPAC_95378 [Pristionchus pacificus]|uniref:Cytochrome P450 n=1 Tax=Pristionchus pacificus TaxID=54126 RepID=A0A2A6BJH0_PRIPA|nr:hypothetical protein PRIPAC_95378 [Pristionchus pacificus]|eukprot:PDM66049.1 cytochrome P450 [Pristionchus pacificus]